MVKAQKVPIDNKSIRIARNTVILFVRMFIVTLLNLYSVKWIIKSLGVDDYGIFNAVAGIVLLGTSFSSVFAITVQRFYSYSLGKKNNIEVQDFFSIALNIVFLFSLLIILLLEICGPSFIETKMTIPPERLNTALWIFHFSIISFVFSCIQIPFIGMVYAYEDMGIYAFISTIECVLKLVLAIFAGKFLVDHLLIYGIGLSIISLLSLILYIFFCSLKYNVCRYKLVLNKKYYKDFISFSSWTLFGSIAGVCTIQGSTILLNTFFSPRINADFAISNQVYNAFNMLVTTTFVAFRPAMIKAYSEGNIQYLNKMFLFSNKAIYYILLIPAIPLLYEMDTILYIWIGKDAITGNTILFSRLFLIYTICLALNNPITTIIYATGKVKKYSLVVETVMLSCLPLSWILFQIGYESYYLFFILICICIIAHIIRIFIFKGLYRNIKISSYLKSFLLPAILITICSCISITMLHMAIHIPLVRLSIVCIASIIIVILLVYFIGINRDERKRFSFLLFKNSII